MIHMWVELLLHSLRSSFVLNSLLSASEIGMIGREKQHRNLSFEIYNNNYYDVQVFFNMFHHLHFRVVILYLCWAVRLVGVAWTWLVQTVLWCLIQIGIQPMMIKQWRVCGEMARKRRYIFLLKSMNCIIIAASQLCFMPLEYPHFIYCTIMLFTMQEVWTIGKKLWLSSWVFLYSRMPSWTQFFLFANKPTVEWYKTVTIFLKFSLKFLFSIQSFFSLFSSGLHLQVIIGKFQVGMITYSTSCRE